ncbi:MAG: site-specific integrase [Candidatus Bathyarchaeia archaeon]|jgi:integrase
MTKQETIQYPINNNIANIQTLLLHLKRKGKSKSYQKISRLYLTKLAKKANLDLTEQVEDAISDLQVSNTTKRFYCTVYTNYCKLFKIIWEKPTYTIEPKGIQPPTNEKIQILIASTRSIKLQLEIDTMAQTGLRPIEIAGQKGLTPNCIHPDQNTITATSTKGCNPRPPMKITNQLMTKIQTYITINKINPNTPIFTGANFSQQFIKYKKRLAKRLNDPSIATIRLYDLRHAYITKQLIKIQNTEIVRQIVGHKQLNTTQKYLHLLTTNTGEWIVESTTDQKRADELLLQDFTYILTTPDGYMKFRKPK